MLKNTTFTNICIRFGSLHESGNEARQLFLLQPETHSSCRFRRERNNAEREDEPAERLWPASQPGHTSAALLQQQAEAGDGTGCGRALLGRGGAGPRAVPPAEWHHRPRVRSSDHDQAAGLLHRLRHDARRQLLARRAAERQRSLAQQPEQVAPHPLRPRTPAQARGGREEPAPPRLARHPVTISLALGTADDRVQQLGAKEKERIYIYAIAGQQ
eukprot:2188559-Pleurochrysis_carterae.AAC.5